MKKFSVFVLTRFQGGAWGAEVKVCLSFFLKKTFFKKKAQKHKTVSREWRGALIPRTALEPLQNADDGRS
jgi:hypothetical protein